MMGGLAEPSVHPAQSVETPPMSCDQILRGGGPRMFVGSEKNLAPVTTELLNEPHLACPQLGGKLRATEDSKMGDTYRDAAIHARISDSYRGFSRPWLPNYSGAKF